MEKSTKAPEALRRIHDESVPEVMEALAKALTGSGPALGFGEISSTEVPDGIAVVIATSGTSGNPKEVAISGHALISSARASNKFLGALFGDTWSLLLPLTHIAGINVLVRCLELGTLPIDIRTEEKYVKADFTAIVPTQLFRALNGNTELLTHLQNCRAVLVGGAPLSATVRKQAEEFDIAVVTTYGMTETSGGCVYNGSPLDGVSVEIRDGVVTISGGCLAEMYLNNAQASNESFVDGSFITGDLGNFENGRLHILGRKDDVIISGGENISLATVEEALSNKFPHNDFAAFAIHDAEWGDALHVAVAGVNKPSASEISFFLAEDLGESAKPKGYLFLDSLPQLSIGKVDRNALVEMAREGI